ncbi:MAG: hypothetical protein LQ344_001077 [Seirophora lacunosa]|nr:MAG: hypothetical protein LQ344_001077 [Seirophora lacunosa]
MWALCVLKTKSQRDSIKTENSEQSYLSYDELCQSVQQNQEQYTVAKAEHVVRNGAQLVDSALRFGRTVEQFLKDFSELLGPAQALDSQNGGVVLPAISLLWHLVSSKQRFEEQMQQQLDGLLEQFRYLHRFRDMYQGRDFSQTNEEGNNLQKPLMPVFEGIADFLGPNLDHVRGLVQKAQEELSFLLSKDARETRNTTMRIKEQCAKLKRKLQAQHAQSIADRLSHLRRLLDLSSFNEQQQKIQFERDLHRTFEFNKKRVLKYVEVPGLLEQDPSFMTWKDSKFSTLLVLSGHSSGTQAAQRFCWLSAAPMKLIDDLQASDCPVAFFNGQVGTTLQDWQARSTDRKALHSIMGQIASGNPSCPERINHQRHIDSQDWDSDNLVRKTKFLQALLDLNGAAEPVYLIFDNLATANEASTRLSERPRPMMIRPLLELVRDVQGVVKMLIVGLKEDFDKG